MKALKATMILTLMLILVPITAKAQNGESTQMYAVHVDPIYPSKISEYENVSKKLVDACKKHTTKMGWAAFQFDGFNYTFITPIKNMAELDIDGFADLQEKMGKDAFGELFTSFNSYYDTHEDYILVLNKELSYMPDGITITPDGLNYRHNTLFYFSPKDYKKMMQVANDFKKLYSDKGSTQYYRVYQSGYGANGTYLLVAEAAKSASAFEKAEEENRKLLGDDAQKLYDKLLDITLKIETMTGYFKPELSYMPN